LAARVYFNGITISRFEKGLIVEDWSVTDTLGMLRQLGLMRSLWLDVRSIRMRKAARPPLPEGQTEPKAQNRSA
jgi:hypothetical protein